MRGITILVKAINKIQLFPAQLTSIHADMCQVRIKIILHIKRYLMYIYKRLQYFTSCTIDSTDTELWDTPMN